MEPFADDSKSKETQMYKLNRRAFMIFSGGVLLSAACGGSSAAAPSSAGPAIKIDPRVVILPYWAARHPDHYRASEIGYEACFLAGLRRLEEDTAPHRPFKILYSSLYANVTPSFVVDISRQFEPRMAALLSYTSQYGDTETASDFFPSHQEIQERLAAIARFYGNLIGVKYGEPFVVKESMQVHDIVNMPVRSI